MSFYGIGEKFIKSIIRVGNKYSNLFVKAMIKRRLVIPGSGTIFFPPGQVNKWRSMEKQEYRIAGLKQLRVKHVCHVRARAGSSSLAGESPSTGESTIAN